MDLEKFKVYNDGKQEFLCYIDLAYYYYNDKKFPLGQFEAEQWWKSLTQESKELVWKELPFIDYVVARGI